MKNSLLICLLLSQVFCFGQNINDNKVSFDYIQLPAIPIDKAFHTYETRVIHSYQQANDDSTALFEARQTAAMQDFERRRIQYQASRDSLERTYLIQLSAWEKQVNAGGTLANGQPLPKPNPPMFPEPPAYPNVKQPHLHTDYEDDAVTNAMKIEGFEKGLGGSILFVTIQPIRNIRIVGKKKGTGASTKYEYTCEYELPIEIKFETPTDGAVLNTVILAGKRTYKMNDQKSQYDHQLYMLDNEDQFYTELERSARQAAIREANEYVNDQLGFMKRRRTAELYSVKRFKQYEYTDVTNAYTATVQALNLVGQDRDCSGAQEKLAGALAMWNEIMIESNTYDNNARINDKISAMIQCNIAEIQLWQAEFNQADATLNLIINSGVFKAKSHANGERAFHTRRATRYRANFE